MPSVTQRIKQIKQPRGGSLTVVEVNGGPLHDIKENVSAGVVGMVIDYMTRVMTGAPVEEAFHVSFLGAKLINAFPRLLDSRSASRVSMTNPSHGHAASRTSMPVYRRLRSTRMPIPTARAGNDQPGRRHLRQHPHHGPEKPCLLQGVRSSRR